MLHKTECNSTLWRRGKTFKFILRLESELEAKLSYTKSCHRQANKGNNCGLFCEWYISKGSLLPLFSKAFCKIIGNREGPGFNKDGKTFRASI